MKGIVIFSLILNVLCVFAIGYILHFEKEDVNEDGEVNALDLLIVQKYIMERNDKK